MPLFPFPPGVDFNHQSVEVPGTRKDGESGVWRSNVWDASVLIAPGQPRTLFELFEQSATKNPDRAVFTQRALISQATSSSPAVYSTDLTPTSYRTAQLRRNAIGSALLAIERSGRLRSPTVPASSPSPAEITFPGIPHYGNANRVKNGARRGWAIGIWSKNSPEWQMVDSACHAYGLVSVSLYETLGPDVAEYITNHCPISMIITSANHLPSLLKIAPRCPSLRVLVSFDAIPDAERKVLDQWASSIGVEVLLLSDLEVWGQEEGIKCAPGPVADVPGDDEIDRLRIVTVSYTSGTTGNPKGVVLTNENFTVGAISNAYGADLGFPITQEWRCISILPLAHIYQRFIEQLVIYGEGTNCYTTGDPTRILEDAQLIKPHYMAGVPRIYNRIHAAVMAQIDAGGLKGALLKHAVDVKLKNWREKGQVTHPIYDALVFRKIRNLLGGELRIISAGGAPLSPEVHEMLKICFSCGVLQGYGMTETVGTATKGMPPDVGAIGTTGQIQPCNECKVVDVPEMGYTSKDVPNPRGELLIRGYNITKGYLHDPENTAKTVDKDGWLATGDIAEIDKAGRVLIIDRKKHVVKLSQGEYVALEKLEGFYILDRIFAALLVHADSSRSHLIALAVLDPARAAELVKRVTGRNVSPGDLAGLETAIQDKKVKKEVLKSFAETAKKQKFNGFETIKGVHLTMKPFPEELLTPTLKMKRSQAAKFYKAEIDAVFAETEKELASPQSRL